MIEKLKNKDIKESAQVFVKGLSMQKPKPLSKPNVNERMDILKSEGTCFIYKYKRKIIGLAYFNVKKANIKIRFICSLKKRKGIGSSLIKEVTLFAVKNKISLIYSTVSSEDERVIRFYDFCGFKRYNIYKASGNFTLYRIKAKPETIIEKLSKK